jgi:hypothetical protein
LPVIEKQMYKMKFLLLTITLILFNSCNESIKKGTQINQRILKRTERIIPTKYNYNLLTVVKDTLNINSPRHLYILNSQNKVIDDIIIFGKVQEFNSNEILINKSFDGKTGPYKIGNLKVIYEKTKKKSFGGVISGKYILEKINYTKGNKKATLHFKKSEKWFTKEDCSILYSLSIPIKDINFEPYHKNYISITSWNKREDKYYNSTKEFKCINSEILDRFYKTLISNGI